MSKFIYKYPASIVWPPIKECPARIEYIPFDEEIWVTSSSHNTVSLSLVDEMLSVSKKFVDTFDINKLVKEDEYPVALPTFHKMPCPPLLPPKPIATHTEVEEIPENIETDFLYKDIKIIDMLLFPIAFYKLYIADNKGDELMKDWIKRKEAYQKVKQEIAEFQEKMDQWNTKFSEYQKIYDEWESNKKEYEMRCNNVIEQWGKDKSDYDQKMHEDKSKLDALLNEYNNKVPKGLIDYYSLILTKSPFPKCFKRNFKLFYDASSKVILIEFQLPDFNKIEILSSAHGKSVKQSERKKYIDKAIYAFAIKVIFEICYFDKLEMIDNIAFNGWVSFHDVTNGNLRS